MPFSKDFLASFLDMSKVDALPTGAEMRVGGFIGPLESAKMYKLISLIDPKDDPEVIKPNIVRNYKSGSFGLYYVDQSAARECQKIVNPKAIINHMWLFRMNTAKLFNANKDRIVEGWGEQVFFELDIAGYASKRAGAINLHFLLIPSMVHAVAKGLGYDVPDFDVSPLVGTQVTVTDEFQARMVGKPDDTIEVRMSESYFGQQRTAIWKALGEDNPFNYTLDVPRSKFNAESDKLKKCLAVINHPWTKGVLAKLGTVTSPVMGDAYGSEGKQNTVPVIMAMFDNEAEAKAMAAAEAKKEEEGGEVKVSNGEPPVPESWADMKGDWLAALEEYKGMSKPKFIKAWDAAGNMGASSSEGWAWVEYLNLKR